MAYDASQIANWFVERAQRDGKTLSIMTLLKLTYIAHGWYLDIRKEPLFTNRIEAWQYGPVIPDVYNDFRKQGVDVAKTIDVDETQAISAADENLLEQTWNIYGALSASKLSKITHVMNGPWALASKIGGHYAKIPDELIAEHYAKLRLRAETSDTAA